MEQTQAMYLQLLYLAILTSLFLLLVYFHTSTLLMS